jgi:hypothetical protein
LKQIEEEKTPGKVEKMTEETGMSELDQLKPEK